MISSSETPEQFNHKVSDRKTKERIDRYLAREISPLSRSRIKSLIDEKKILVNGSPVKSSYMLSPGDVITATVPPPVKIKAKPENIPLNIIYEDEDIAVINKPAGMVVHPAHANYSGTLVNALLYRINDLSGINGELRPGIVHRLDKDTSGVIIVAKNDHSHRTLSEQFSARTIQKEYRAVVWHKVKKTRGIIDRPLLPSRKDRTKMIVNPMGKQSVTHYKIEKEYEFFTLLSAFPKTGRTHQIRAHLTSIGHPIVGDDLYGGTQRQIKRLSSSQKKIAVEVLNLMRRQALHAYKITFTHPSGNEILTFEASIAQDMENLLRYLEKECRILA